MAYLLCYNKADFNREMTRLGVCDSNVAEWTRTAFVSIGEPGDGVDGHWFKEGHPNVLNIDFPDIDEYSVAMDARDVEWKDMPHGLTREQAEIIYEFIKANLGRNFIIHCSAGISRSQGVVHFMLNYYHEYYTFDEINKRNPPHFPNLHVVNRLRELFLKEEMDKSGWILTFTDSNSYTHDNQTVHT